MPMRHFKNLFWYLSSFGINTTLQLVSLWFYNKYFTKEDFGIYAFISIIGIITVAFSNLGLLSIYQRNFFELSDKLRNELLNTIIVFILLCLFIWSFFTYFFFDLINEYFFNSNLISVKWVIFGQFFFVVQSINLFYYSNLKNTFNAKLFSILSITEKFISYFISGIIIYFYEYTFEALLAGQLLSVLILLFYFITSFLKKQSFQINYKLFFKSLKLAAPLSPVQIIKVIGNQSDKYFIGYFSNLSTLGLYDVALKLSNVSFIFSSALQNVFSPKVYELLFSNKKNKKNLLGNYLTPFFYLTALFCLLVSIFIEEIVIIFLDDTFMKIVPVTIFLNMLYLLQFFTKQPQLVYAKKTTLLSSLSLGLIIGNTLLNIPLVFLFGIYGAITSTLLTGVIYILLYVKYGQIYAPIEYEKNKINLILFLFFSITILNLILFLNEINYTFRILIKILGLVGYIIVGFKLTIFSVKWDITKN